MRENRLKDNDNHEVKKKSKKSPLLLSIIGYMHFRVQCCKTRWSACIKKMMEEI